ncbi:DivIVA domain-containing protein [Nakamurella leprariae]|nr:DivIVA domain-containing protein [Nakamurella leprariae]
MTLLQYLLIAAVIGLAVFGIAVVVFGRGEQMAPLPPRTSPAHLPDGPITGSDVEQVRFGLAVRGYRMSDVDWTLHRLSGELDRLRARLRELDPDAVNGPRAGTDVAAEATPPGGTAGDPVPSHAGGAASEPIRPPAGPSAAASGSLSTSHEEPQR